MKVLPRNEKSYSIWNSEGFQFFRWQNHITETSVEKFKFCLTMTQIFHSTTHRREIKFTCWEVLTKNWSIVRKFRLSTWLLPAVKRPWRTSRSRGINEGHYNSILSRSRYSTLRSSYGSGCCYFYRAYRIVLRNARNRGERTSVSSNYVAVLARISCITMHVTHERAM